MSELIFLGLTLLRSIVGLQGMIYRIPGFLTTLPVVREENEYWHSAIVVCM